MTTMAPTSQETPVKGRRYGRWQKMSPLSYVTLGIVGFLSLFPFYWMFIVASNGSDEISKIPPSVVPGDNFFKVVADVNSILPKTKVFFDLITIDWFYKALLNTFFVGFTIAFVQVITSALVSAFGVFWMRQVIDAQIPNELLEAASIDRASVLRVFWSVVLPIIRPSGFVLGLFAFLATWNDFLWPTLVLQSPDNFTAQVAVTQLNASYVLNYSLNMGGALMATAPLLLLFVLVGRRLVQGVMDGAVKG